MLGSRFLSRPQWEKKLTDIGAQRVQTGTFINTAEWWRCGDGLPFTVPVEDDGSCEFWAIQRILKDQGAKTPFGGWH